MSCRLADKIMSYKIRPSHAKYISLLSVCFAILVHKSQILYIFIWFSKYEALTSQRKIGFLLYQVITTPHPKKYLLNPYLQPITQPEQSQPQINFQSCMGQVYEVGRAHVHCYKKNKSVFHRFSPHRIRYPLFKKKSICKA